MNLPINTRGNLRNSVFIFISLLLLLVATAMTVSSDEPRPPAILHPLANANFKSTDDPACLATAVEIGNPSTGPSTVLLKANRGCVVRWHFHSAQEQLMVIKGELKIELTSRPSTTLSPGGFVFLPSKEKHQFTCTHKSECLFFLMIDRAYDSAWVRPDTN